MVSLVELEPWPDTHASQASRDRYRLLSTVAAQLGITSPHPTRPEWRAATIPNAALPDLRDAINKEGRRTDPRRVSLPGGHQWRPVGRHPDRARQQLLARIDAHLP